MYAQAAIKSNTLLRNGAYGIVMRGVQKCTRGCSSLRGRNRLPLCCIKLDTATDPCMGSGHILVYAFDVFMEIYKAQGYTERDAAKLIVENNLYGLEIDDRAAQLACFAVMMKARSYDRRFLTRGVRPNLCAVQESNSIKNEDLELFGDLEPAAQRFVKEYIDAKEYGSILNLKIDPAEYEQIKEKYFEIEQAYYDNVFDITKRKGLHKLFPALINQTEIIMQKYEVVCTNPPYMGGSGMSAKLSAFVKKNYPDSKSDLFSVFIEKGNNWVVRDGYNSMVTMQSWMFLSSFEKMRSNILVTKTIVDLMHMDNMVMGIAFGTAVTIFKNCRVSDYRGTYIKISLRDIIKDPITALDRPRVFPNYSNRYAEVSTDNFSKIPGSPIAYWVSNNFRNAFSNKSVRDITFAGIGMRTGDNNRFLRLWFETPIAKVAFNCKDAEETTKSGVKWIPYNKGGNFRRWYGNNEYVVNWENNGFEIKENTKKVYPQLGDNLGWKITNEPLYFKQGITWTVVSSKYTSFRRYDSGFIFSNSGQAIVDDNANLLDYLIGFLNTNIVIEFLSLLSPTMGFESGYINKIPVKIDDYYFEIVTKIVNKNIALSRTDWDSFETSWDFKTHPLV